MCSFDPMASDVRTKCAVVVPCSRRREVSQQLSARMSAVRPLLTDPRAVLAPSKQIEG